ncbi:MAG: hypothetical protein ACKO90_34570, partial [Microcystis panniformis]
TSPDGHPVNISCRSNLWRPYGAIMYMVDAHPRDQTHTTVPIAPPFIEEAFWFYPENKNLEQQQVVKAIATMQEWIDTGISMELLFNLNEGVYFPAEPNRCLTAKDIFDTLIMAWELGCKAIYYVRTVQKDNFRESDDSCSSCAN